MSMTRKQALAILRRDIDTAFEYALHTDHARHEERWTLYKEMLTAVNVLTPLVHGHVPHDCLAVLCEACRMRYISRDVLFSEGHGQSAWLCHVCREADVRQAAHVAPTSEVRP